MSGPEPGASAEVAGRHWPGTPLRGDERPVTVDQTHTSVIVDDLVVVKWLVPPVPEPHPGVRLLAHLAEVGFDEMPPFLGAEVRDGQVVALLTGYVADALDGWDWFVDEVTGWLRGEHDDAAPLASAARVGALAARLHVALATPSAVISQPLGTGRVEPLLARAVQLLDRALSVVDEVGAECLVPRADLVREALLPLGDLGPITVQPVHGDLHVGQLLRSGRTLVVTDFDGNPMAGAAHAFDQQPAAVDVASLVQSVDHVGRVAARRVPAHADRAAGFAREGAELTLQAYRGELARLDHAHLLDERLLAPLRVAQELHELVYAARHLPRWAYVPIAALTEMFPLDDGQQAGSAGGSRTFPGRP